MIETPVWDARFSVYLGDTSVYDSEDVGDARLTAKLLSEFNAGELVRLWDNEGDKTFERYVNGEIELPPAPPKPKVTYIQPKRDMVFHTMQSSDDPWAMRDFYARDTDDYYKPRMREFVYDEYEFKSWKKDYFDD